MVTVITDALEQLDINCCESTVTVRVAGAEAVPFCTMEVVLVRKIVVVAYGVGPALTALELLLVGTRTLSTPT